MLLHWSPASPYVRKVMACAILRGIDLPTVETNPHASPPELLAVNPLSKVPCLVTDDGRAIFDSRVIVGYLDTIGTAPPVVPRDAARIRVLTWQALADGILDAAVMRRMEAMRPAEAARTANMDRQKAAIDRALALLEATPPAGLNDVGVIAVACALGYLDFRFGQEPWREAHPKLAAWFAKVSQLPPLARTEPRAPA
ncbi:glutathione S-transferase N-terminal domain-containing protein [Roseomonas sp. CCTCC AB2023176]|uniref:glutathione S-transferase N-terminal domain-containing protein n=1 Tax=Roseomonas sp. CCTCC AB2023176 TaxID=3342640 RepID=UPI0035DE1C0D